MDKQAIYDYINEAKAALIPKHADGATKDTVVTEDANKQYTKEAMRIFGTNPISGRLIIPKTPEPIIAAVRSAKTLATLRKRARSVRHISISILNAALKAADAAQRNGDWVKVEQIVKTHEFRTFIALCKLMPSDYADDDSWKPIKSRSSKKRALPGLPPNWREKIAGATKGQFQIAVLVVLLTGCRPAELEKGVLIERIGDHLYATIQGVKVKENAGQKQRRFRIADHPITNQLMHVMDKSDETRNVMLVKVEHGNSVTTNIRAIGKKIWPRKKHSVTSYCSRHVIAADCKAATASSIDPDFDLDLVSKVLGHIVDKTASFYGSGFQSGSISMAPSEVEVPHEIKHKVRERNQQRAVNLGILKPAKTTLNR